MIKHHPATWFLIHEVQASSSKRGNAGGRALRAHRRGLLLLLEPLEELDARLGLDLLAGLAADLLGVGRRADLARAVDLRAVDGGDEALEPELTIELVLGNRCRNPDLYV